MSKALESKHDKILKSLLRQPDNKRCINCETLVCDSPARLAIGFTIIWWINFTFADFANVQGPQYAVSDLQIFVCTICSGVQ